MLQQGLSKDDMLAVAPIDSFGIKGKWQENVT